MADEMMKKEIAKKLLGKLQNINLDDVQSLTLSLVMKGSSMEPKEMEDEGYEEEMPEEEDKEEEMDSEETDMESCPNCGEECSSEDQKCPNCNCKLREGKQAGKLNMPNKHMMMKKMRGMMEQD